MVNTINDDPPIVEEMKHKIGDIVRVQRVRKTFEKSFSETKWSDLVFRIINITSEESKKGLIPVYQLGTYANRKPIPGRYYNNDLQSVISPQIKFRLIEIKEDGQHILEIPTLDKDGHPSFERGVFVKNGNGKYRLI